MTIKGSLLPQVSEIYFISYKYQMMKTFRTTVVVAGANFFGRAELFLIFENFDMLM